MFEEFPPEERDALSRERAFNVEMRRWGQTRTLILNTTYYWLSSPPPGWDRSSVELVRSAARASITLDDFYNRLSLGNRPYLLLPGQRQETPVYLRSDLFSQITRFATDNYGPISPEWDFWSGSYR